MHFSSFFTTAALAGLSLAANTDVKVSNKNGDLTFTPNNITAAAGDTVTFMYYPKAHSVVQSTFADPCTPMKNGFWSGFVNVSSGVSQTMYMITVNDTKPIWFYCSQGKHCQAGMVGAINAPASGNTIAAYNTSSTKATKNTSPDLPNGFGGMLMTNSSMASSASGSASMSGSTASSTASGSAASSTGAASSVEVSKALSLVGGLAFLGYALI